MKKMDEMDRDIQLRSEAWGYKTAKKSSRNATRGYGKNIGCKQTDHYCH